MQWPLAVLTLVLVLAQSTWTMLIAVAVKVTFLTAPVAPLLAVSMVIVRMLE